MNVLQLLSCNKVYNGRFFALTKNEEGRKKISSFGVATIASEEKKKKKVCHPIVSAVKVPMKNIQISQEVYYHGLDF